MLADDKAYYCVYIKAELINQKIHLLKLDLFWTIHLQYRLVTKLGLH